MLILNVAGKPFPMVNFSTDDFGNEIQAVMNYFSPSSCHQVKLTRDTYFHLLDMELSIRAESACAIS